MAARTSAGLIEAERHFRKAIALDPKFALAWVGLADTLSLQTGYGGRPIDAALGEAEQAVDRALELDPNLAEAWASAGMVALAGCNCRASEADVSPRDRAQPQLCDGASLVGRTSDRTRPARRGLGGGGARRRARSPVGDHQHLGWAHEGKRRTLRRGARRVPTGDRDRSDMAGLPYGGIGDLHAYGFGRFDMAHALVQRKPRVSIRANPGSRQYLRMRIGNSVTMQRRAVVGSNAGERRGNVCDANFVAALLYLDRGDEASARRHAQGAARGGPESILVSCFATTTFAKATTRPPAPVTRRRSRNCSRRTLPEFTDRDAFAAIDLALVLQHTGEEERARALLDRSEAYSRTIPRMGDWLRDTRTCDPCALRGDTTEALAKLREAEQAGWRRWWRYYRDFDPNLASIRNEPEFKAVFADIERDMAQQRARLAARPKDAPLELTDASR